MSEINKMKSMTGFGSAKGQTPFSFLEVHTRSVNGRFLELRVHGPREMGGIESEIKKIVSGFFQRGSVDVFVSRKSRGEKSPVKLHLHEEMAKAWLEATEKLSKGVGQSLTGSLDLPTLLQLPEVVGFEEELGTIEQDAEEVLRLTQAACLACDQERQREGESLKRELLGILDRLDEAMLGMAELQGDVNRHLREKMEFRLKSRWPDLSIDDQRLQQEFALMWDKSDITEEMTRLKEHLQHYRHLLVQSKAQGRKLDFYTQELLREVNTVGSKSPMAQLTHLVVTAKTEIEKLREQVQNIE